MKNKANILEEGGKVMLDFCKLRDYFIGQDREKGIMPVVVQGAKTKEVLILAYANQEALDYSLKNRVAAFWSTSRNELWVKGLTSGSVLKLIEIRVNCEQNSLLYLVEPLNGAGACHTKEKGGYRKSCYYRKMLFNGKKLEKIKEEKVMKKLVLAIPNGSLKERTLKMLRKAGLTVNFNGRNFEIKIYGSSLFDRAILMRPQKIPGAVARGVVDVGITGKDWLEEKKLEKKLEEIQKLNYGKTSSQAVKIVVFGKAEEIVDEKSIMVSAEYINLAKTVFKKAKIEFSDGSTEVDVSTGTYDYGVGVCESGQSLRDNGLKILQVIMESPVVLIAKKFTPELKAFGEILNGTLEAEKRCLIKFDCGEEAKDEILAFLPAIDAPTVNRLSNGNYAIETVASKDETFDLLMRLKLAGARGVIVQDFNIIL
ncbi:MAG: ATP phosphoribosyltransferase [bacterium]|nr:ATP phosphoribosyltransferase [bacterium]